MKIFILSLSLSHCIDYLFRETIFNNERQQWWEPSECDKQPTDPTHTHTHTFTQNKNRLVLLSNYELDPISKPKFLVVKFVLSLTMCAIFSTYRLIYYEITRDSFDMFYSNVWITMIGIRSKESKLFMRFYLDSIYSLPVLYIRIFLGTNNKFEPISIDWIRSTR